MVDASTVEYTCPRCQSAVTERYYGPCSACRDQLRQTMAIAPRETENAQYEPKMNVVPNQVATKD